MTTVMEPYTPEGVYDKIYPLLGANIQKENFQYSNNLNDIRTRMFPCGGV